MKISGVDFIVHKKSGKLNRILTNPHFNFLPVGVESKVEKLSKTYLILHILSHQELYVISCNSNHL